jgi:ribosomal protein S27AE
MNERLYRWFGGRSAVCATQHGKERAMGPLLAQHAGIQLFTLPEFDTDRFGTFTREIPRAGSMIEAARAKAISAAEIACVDLALASEGSFGPHPSFGLIAGNFEIVLLLDRRYGLEIVGQHLTTNVRWVHGVVHSAEQALELAQRGGFPSHAMVVRRSENDPVGMIKGLNDEISFVQAVQHLLATNEGRPIFIESDLRAHCNPTRMQNIHCATLDLLEEMARFCPACGAPGFQRMEAVPGLLCRWCRLPTSLPSAYRFQCNRCGYQLTQTVEESFADPGQCSFCNP